MDFFEYLNYKLNNDNTIQPPIIGTNSLQNETNHSIYENEPVVKLNDEPIFQFADKRELNEINIDKILNNPKEGENPITLSPLEWILKQFFSFDEIKEAADTDGIEGISEEEAKEFIQKLINMDGDGETLSVYDFNSAIFDYNIDLDDNILTQEILSNTELDNTSYAPARDINYFEPSTNYSNVSYNNYVPKTSYVRKLEDMSLDELKEQKASRVKNLEEKQKDLINVQNRNTDEIKNAIKNKNDKMKAYCKALNKDNAAKPFRKNIEENENAIIKNTKNILKCEKEITENKAKVLEQEHNYKLAQNNLNALEEALSNMPEKTGNAKEDSKIDNKAKEIRAKISKQKELVTKEKEKLDKLNEEQEKLTKTQEELNETKEKLLATKEELDKKVEESCSQATKNALKAYNSAVQEYEEIKNQQLEAAANALNEAKKSVNEVNELILKAETAKTKNENSFTPVMNINNVSKEFISKYGVQEKTLPDGTKILSCRWSRFSKMNSEWLNQQQAMLKAASDLGLTLVYSDVERTVAESNAGRAKKGNLVASGGNSPHNYGCAVDIVLFKNGQAVNANSPIQTEFANKVKEYSNGAVTWGGDWRKTGERHHFELTGWRKYKSSGNLVG